VAKAKETDIEAEVVEVLSMEQELVKLQTELSENDQFKKFIDFQQKVKDKSTSNNRFTSIPTL